MDARRCERLEYMVKVEGPLRAAERTDLELLVRLFDTDPTLVQKALEQVEQIIKFIKFEQERSTGEARSNDVLAGRPCRRFRFLIRRTEREVPT